jgi:hypothetical protein
MMMTLWPSSDTAKDAATLPISIVSSIILRTGFRRPMAYKAHQSSYLRSLGQLNRMMLPSLAVSTSWQTNTSIFCDWRWLQCLRQRTMDGPPLQQNSGSTRTTCQSDWCGPKEGAATPYHHQQFLLFFACRRDITAPTYGWKLYNSVERWNAAFTTSYMWILGLNP